MRDSIPTWDALKQTCSELSRAKQTAGEIEAALANIHTARPLDEWHEDVGAVLWWRFPIVEPPWVGTPMDDGWTGWFTHWTPLPSPKEIQQRHGLALALDVSEEASDYSRRYFKLLQDCRVALAFIEEGNEAEAENLLGLALRNHALEFDAKDESLRDVGQVWPDIL